MNFSSETLPPNERPVGYQAALRRYFSSFDTTVDVEVEPDTAELFRARLKGVRIGQLGGALHFSNSPHFLRAGAGPDAHDGFDFYFVSKGRISFDDSAGTVDLQAGDMALRSSNSSFAARSEQFEMLALGLPSGLLRMPGAKKGGGSYKLDGDSGLSACLQAMLRTALTRHTDFTAGEGAVLQTSILDAIVYLGAGGKEHDLCSRNEDKLREVKALALRLLPLTTLTPDYLAREMGISLRTLHRLFNVSGTSFGVWLREARLERCWRDLTEPRRQRATVAAIAFEWGFNDLRTFNRAFAARYGVTPSAARKTLASVT